MVVDAPVKHFHNAPDDHQSAGQNQNPKLVLVQQSVHVADGFREIDDA